MSEHPEGGPASPPTHSPTTVRASIGGGAGKWLIGAAAAVVLAGGGYLIWQNNESGHDTADIAYNDPYAPDTLRAGPLAPSPADDETVTAETDQAAPAPAPRARNSAPARQAARAEPIPEATFGLASATTQDSDEIVVNAPRRPVWTRTPSARRLATFYPERALAFGREGEARLRCTVLENGALDCARVEETPGGFGTAAMRVARTLRHAPQRADGSDAVGTPVNLRVVFRIDEDSRRG